MIKPQKDFVKNKSKLNKMLKNKPHNHTPYNFAPNFHGAIIYFNEDKIQKSVKKMIDEMKTMGVHIYVPSEEPTITLLDLPRPRIIADGKEINGLVMYKPKI